MKISLFDVVELNDGNRAIIKNIDNKKYFAEIVNQKGDTIENRNILQNEINNVVFQKNI